MSEPSRYLGQNSIPALLREQSSPYEHQEGGVEYIRQDMRSILGLDTSAPFPLMSSRHLDRLTIDIAAELPSDREVMKYAPVSAHVSVLLSPLFANTDDASPSPRLSRRMAGYRLPLCPPCPIS